MSYKDDINVLSGRLHRIIGMLCDLEEDLGIIYDELGAPEQTCHSDEKKSELLTCPFCGGEAQVQHQSRKLYGDVVDWYGVYCKKQFCGYVSGQSTEAEAIAAWNTRAECENCAALNKAAGLWAKADSEKRNRDESIHNLIKLLDKRQELIQALESLIRDMYGEWCATIDDYYEQRIDEYYERMTELGIEVSE